MSDILSRFFLIGLHHHAGGKIQLQNGGFQLPHGGHGLLDALAGEILEAHGGHERGQIFPQDSVALNDPLPFRRRYSAPVRLFQQRGIFLLTLLKALHHLHDGVRGVLGLPEYGGKLFGGILEQLVGHGLVRKQGFLAPGAAGLVHFPVDTAQAVAHVRTDLAVELAFQQGLRQGFGKLFFQCGGKSLTQIAGQVVRNFPHDGADIGIDGGRLHAVSPFQPSLST